MSNDKYSLYDPNDVVQAVVCDIGSYATKMGFAGEDFPKSYFRSNVAVLRDQTTKSPHRHRSPIEKVHYDYFTRPLQYPQDSDGPWETANPVDPTTGLLYGDDWYELVQAFMKHAFDTTLLTAPADQPLLLCERSYNPPPVRQQLLEVLMEELNVPAAFLARDATLACYACGRTTGTVVDIGYHGTTVTPVYEGYVELKGIRRSPIGTKEMDTSLMGHLDRAAGAPYLPLYQVRKYQLRREDFHGLARLAVAQDCREEGIGAGVPSQVDAQFQAPSGTFQLPDGTVVDVPAKIRFAVTDLLLGQEDSSISTRAEKVAQRKQAFAALLEPPPVTLDHDNNDTDEDDPIYQERYSEAAAVGVSSRKRPDEPHPPPRPPFSNRHLQRACMTYLTVPHEALTDANLPAMVCEAAFACDRDQQASLLGNLVLAGGGACVGPTDQALPEFLREKMEGLIHQHTPGWRVKVLSPNYQERKVCSWLGGSILGSLGSFHDMYISKKEYEEWGSAIVNRKCP